VSRTIFSANYFRCVSLSSWCAFCSSLSSLYAARYAVAVMPILADCELAIIERTSIVFSGQLASILVSTGMFALSVFPLASLCITLLQLLTYLLLHTLSRGLPSMLHLIK
jgi:hypothetical protein